METNGIYIVAIDSSGGIWIIPVPKNVEEADFKEKIKNETGASVCGVGYLTTVAQLKHEQGRRSQRGRALPMSVAKISKHAES